MTFQEIMDKQLGSIKIGNVLEALIVLAVCIIVIKLVMKVVSRALDKLSIEKSFHTFIKSSLKILLEFLALLMVMGCLNIPITSLVALFSVAGLAVSLALQGSLSNLASGFLLLSARPFKVGDYVEISDSGGTVAEIGLIYTKLVTVDNKAVFVPNGDVSAGKIINYTAQDRRRIELHINAPYDVSTEVVKKALSESIDHNSKYFLSDPAPFVRISSFGESSIAYVIRIWAKTENYWDGYYSLLEDIRETFAEKGINMPFNRLDVHVKS